MLDVGFSEILLTSAIALIVLGPERLPKVARQVGNWMGRARAMARQLSEQLEREVSAEEFLKIQNKPGASTSSPGINSPGINSPGINSPGINSAGGDSPDGGAAPAVMTAASHAPQSDAAAASSPEPTYGLAASATTPAAMHASDPPVTDPNQPHE